LFFAKLEFYPNFSEHFKANTMSTLSAKRGKRYRDRQPDGFKAAEAKRKQAVYQEKKKPKVFILYNWSLTSENLQQELGFRIILVDLLVAHLGERVDLFYDRRKNDPKNFEGEKVILILYSGCLRSENVFEENIVELYQDKGKEVHTLLVDMTCEQMLDEVSKHTQ
jgi:hypothetical protein